MAKNETKITATPGGQAVVIEREFDAPVDKVWRAWTDPEIYIKWMGPDDLKGKINEWSMKPGGKYSYTHSDAEGNEFTFIGFGHLVEEKKKLVSTFEWLGMPGHVSLNFANFEDLGGGRTKVTSTAVFETVEDRDGMVQSGMERGVVEGNNRLDKILATL